MTRLRILHQTTYSYRNPVRFARHRLVLRPREGHDVRVVNMTLQISPAYELLWSRDVFGNSVALVDFPASSDELSIRSDVTIERHEPLKNGATTAREPVRYPVTYDVHEATVASAYLNLIYTDVALVKSWMKPIVSGSDDALESLSALNREIHRQIRYQRRDEKGVQSPAQTLESGVGSCRDMATLMMEAARSLGIAARFASGYLDCAAAEAGRAAMHAWAEVYLTERGWIGYDPTIGELTSEKHVVVGVSNHPRGVMPVSGRYLGSSSEYLEMKVAVDIQKGSGIA
ncbi:MAG TPA: transglutaminase family protein [Pyrinomonadaceae bacterium]|jgi:transglutaminase-like putative cysteine protease